MLFTGSPCLAGTFGPSNRSFNILLESSHLIAAKLIVGQPFLQPTLIVGKPSYCCQVHRGQPSSANTHRWSAILLLTSTLWSAFFSQHSLLASHLIADKLIVVSPSAANIHRWSVILLLTISSWSAFFSQHTHRW